MIKKLAKLALVGARLEKQQSYQTPLLSTETRMLHLRRHKPAHKPRTTPLVHELLYPVLRDDVTA